MHYFKKSMAYLLAFCVSLQLFVTLDCGLKVSAASCAETTAEYTFEYLSNKGWTTFNSSVTGVSICAIRIKSPKGKPYYLKYQTWNTGKENAYPAVSSNDYDEYAGVSGRTVERFGISVYASDYNRKLATGIVVMYRAYVAGKWLDWVSNADSASMDSVYSEHALSGALDKSSFYAGKSGTALSGLEIRIFEGEIPPSFISSLPGEEYEPSLSYSVDSLNQISFSKSAKSPMDCLWIRTASSKKYYLQYRVASVAGWYSYVKSTASDYAGAATKRITKLQILAKNTDDSSLNAGVVVMYRVKAKGNWLPWVSNADPDWMVSAQIKYNLNGVLDFTGSYAGLSDGTAIEGVEIHVFEENRIDNGIASSGESKIISTPHFYQSEKYPTGCESVSTVAALNFFGVGVSVDTFIDRYLEKGSYESFDPNLCFGGDPRSNNGYGCYAPVIANAVNKAIGGKKLKVSKLYNQRLQELCNKYIDNNIPVILWATMDMKKPYNGNKIIYNGRTIQWVAPEHCLLLVGYDKDNYIFRDPLNSQTVSYYSKQSVSTAYLGMGAQAVVIEPADKTAPIVPSGAFSAPEEQPSDIPYEYLKPNESEFALAGKGIDLYTGSHMIAMPLLSLFGGQSTAVSAQYNSGRLSRGDMGIGWYHNYEKRLEIKDGFIRAYDNPSVYSDYIKTGNGDNTYYCTAKGRSGYTVTECSDGGYLLNRNYEGTESYDANGKLVCITDKQGFETKLSYSENTLTVTDRITDKSLFLEKGEDGFLCRVYDENGRQTALSYENGYLVSVTDADGNILSYTYNNNGKIETGTDSNGTCSFTDIYDQNGRVIAQADGTPEHSQTKIAYGENGSRTVTDRTGAVSSHAFDQNGRLVSYTDGNGNTFGFQYDANFNITRKTDPLGAFEESRYNSFDKPTVKRDKNGVATFYSYDSHGNLTSVIHPQKGDANSDGYVDILDLVRLKKKNAKTDELKNDYNGDINFDGEINSLDLVGLRQKLIEIRVSESSKESYEYNEYNQLVSYTDLRGAVTSYYYDSSRMLTKKSYGEKQAYYSYQNGMLMSETDFDGNTVNYQYNAFGKISEKTDANGTTSYEYDNYGSILKTADASGEITLYTYDGNRQMRSKTDPLGNVTWYSYTGNMMLSEVTLPEGGKPLYEYDGEDRLIKSADKDGNITETAYDAAGRIVKESYSHNITALYEYDAAGNIIKETDKYGAVTEYTYDGAGNRLTSTDSAGKKVSYIYDALGHVIKETNAAGAVTEYSYNAAGDLLSEMRADGTAVIYTYDIYGNRLNETVIG